MTTWPILSVVTFLPALGALLVYALARGSDEAANRNARWIALWTTVVTFAVSLILVWRFDASSADFQFVEKTAWLASGPLPRVISMMRIAPSRGRKVTTERTGQAISFSPP